MGDMDAKREKLKLNLKPMPKRSLKLMPNLTQKLMLNLTQKLMPTMDTEVMADMEDMVVTVDMVDMVMAEEGDQPNLIVDMEAMEDTVVVMAVAVMAEEVMEDTVMAVN